MINKNNRSRALTLEEHKQSSSDQNNTDDDLKPPILGKNKSTFQKMMQSDAFERQSCNSFVSDKNDATLVIDNTKHLNLSKSHKRQISSGHNIPILGDDTLLNNSPHENIEPEEVEVKLMFNRQIESMQIGRVSKKNQHNNFS